MANIVHNKKHGIDSTTDHTGVASAVENNLTSFDGSGLPKDSGVAVSDLTGHIAAANPHSGSAALGANTDITSLTGITGNISSVNVLNFNIAPTNATPVEGDAWWSATDHTLNLKTDSDPILQVGQEMYVYGKNVNGDQINNGELVIITGASGERPTLIKAKADAEATSEGTIAMATHSIGDNTSGYYTTIGLVRGLNTNADSDGNVVTEGDKIYLSATVAGGWTNVPPASPLHTTVVGFVVRKHESEGIIFVKIIDGQEMQELHDVEFVAPSVTGQILAWNNSTGVYELNTHINDNNPHTNSAPIASPTFTGAVAVPQTALGTASTSLFVDDSGTIKTRTVAQILSDIGASPTVHAHSGSDITSGTLPDARIQATGVTQHVGSIDHNSTLNYAIAQHRIINDAGTNSDELWSASQISAVTGAISAGIVHRKAVINKVDNTVAPPTEVLGDRYILDETGGGVHADWDGASANDIVEYNGATWDATSPLEGWMAHNDTDTVNELFISDGTPAWQKQGSTVDHEILIGLLGGTTNEHYHLTSAQHVIATQAATTSLSGYLTSTDWNTFNNHIGATGASHSYIDQSVIIASSPTFVDMTFTDPQGDPFTVRDLSAHQLDAFNELATTEFDLTCVTALGVRTITATQPESEKFEFIISEKRIEQPVQQVMTQVHTGLEGTDAIPKTIYTYFKNDGADEPELFATNASPDGSTAHVDAVYEVVGSIAGSVANVYATNNGKAYIHEKIEAMIDRSKEEGNLYKSGIDITADADSFATSVGVVRHILANATIPALELNRLVAVDTQFTIEDDNTYITYDDFQIDEYYDGIAVGNNHHVKCRVLAVINNPELTSARYHIIPQAGTTVYATPSQAWADLSKMIRTTPRDNTVKYASVHIADIVIKNTGGTFTLIANPDTGLFYNDVRSESGGAGGGGAASQNLYETFTGDSGTSTASSSTDTMATVGGNLITTTVTDDQISIAADAAVTGATKGEVIVTFDEGGGVLTTGAKNIYIQMPYAGTITSATLLADVSGSIVVDVWKDTYANFPPTVADTVVASAPPTITTATKSTDSTLTGWTKTFSAGDIYEFNINSVSTITKCFLTLKYDKTGV